MEQVNLHSQKTLEEKALRNRFTALLRGNASRLTLYQEANTPEKQKILEEVQGIQKSQEESARANAYVREKEEVEQEFRRALKPVGTSEEKILQTFVVQELVSRAAARIRNQEAQNRERAIDLQTHAAMIPCPAGQDAKTVAA